MKSKIIERERRRVNNGYMGFSDYSIEFEPLEKFVDRVNCFVETVSDKFVSMNYSGNLDIAIVTYRE